MGRVGSMEVNNPRKFGRWEMCHIVECNKMEIWLHLLEVGNSANDKCPDCLKSLGLWFRSDIGLLRSHHVSARCLWSDAARGSLKDVCVRFLMRPLNLRRPGILMLSFSVYKLALLAGSTSQNRLFIPSPSSRLCKVHSSTLCSNAIQVRSCFSLGQVVCVLFIFLSCQCSVVSSVAHFWPSCLLIICPSSPSGDGL